MLKGILRKRELPDFKTREEMIDILQKEEYGYLPEKPEKITWKTTENFVPKFCASKADFSKIDLTCTLNGKDFTFPVYSVIPTKEGKYPFFIHINFRPDVPDRYMPTEELVDNGFAVLSFCYKDVTNDNDDFTDGLAGIIFENGERKNPDDPGKISMWAWAAQRVLDYAESIEKLDKNCVTVCGHSRLGKTALLASATDERFTFAYSNNSGCSGDAITRAKGGERVANITDEFPYWFCENYKKYIDKEHEMPFDQHFLLAAIAPRYVAVGAAKEDRWADPDSQMLCCVAASDFYKKQNQKGFISENRLPQIDDVFHEGNIGYHLRAGTHYFSREDWLKLIHFINLHK